MSLYLLAAQASDAAAVEVDDAPEGEAVVKKSKKGKKVTWASDDKINVYHFFEMDEEERGMPDSKYNCYL